MEFNVAPIRLKLISGECKVVSSLSRVLGQYQINSSKFCLKINEYSDKNFVPGILFYVYILKKEGRDNYDFYFGSPCFKQLLLILFDIDSSNNNSNSFSLTLEEFYDFYRIFLKLSKNRVINLNFFLGSFQSLGSNFIIKF